MNDEKKIMRIEVEPGMKNARLFVNGLRMPLSTVADILTLMKDAMAAAGVDADEFGLNDSNARTDDG